ncbi:GNAT family N-acetyltransferase [Erwiniaceae bacterium BAC15a-03b]|uniref:GNAT family N-acetyltransferase n=1 Tax=Winslowiella arboricola TaxID=2978220 RepID=A0A9J6PXS7_9GAMM|nr:GNAT family N-acetyltransferase [Winslowiella arboricola]MCU5775331.1 GNAT family N-acetyltransferase [Winslowiella arboricola]MCU5780272.1 GNAT family N-acetyltransferase [Winslowiella arboricola]
MNVSVTLCEKDDWEKMVGIFTAMEEHYYGNGIITREKMAAYLSSRVFAAESAVTVIRAEHGPAVIGFACVSILYPSPRYSGQMFIKELFIAETHRGKGAGRKLMQFIANMATERDCLTLDWMSEKNNQGSKQFYTSLGGEILDGMFHFRLYGDALRNLARQ